jgi:hypothetical protein
MSDYPAGYELVRTKKCPLGAVTSIACLFCNEGHPTECHHGMTCKEANCDHLDRYDEGVY